MEAIEQVKDFAGLIKLIMTALNIAGGGPAFWIAAALSSLLAAALWVWIQEVKKTEAWRKSQENAQREQAGGKIENDQISEAAKKAEERAAEEAPPGGPAPRVREKGDPQ